MTQKERLVELLKNTIKPICFPIKKLEEAEQALKEREANA